MESRFGVAAVLLALLVAGIAAATVRADTTTPAPTTPSATDEASTTDTAAGVTTTTDTTTPAPTTAVPTVSTSAAVPTATVPTATAPPTTQPTPTVQTTQPAETGAAPAATAPTTTTAAARVLPVASRVDGGCFLVGAVAFVTPRGSARVLGPVAQSPSGRDVARDGIAYPANGSIVTAASIDLRTSGCGMRRLASGRAEVSSLSLFGGAITARRVQLGVRGGVPVESGVSGLEVGGKPVAVQPGRRLPVQDWGYVVALAAPPVAAARHQKRPLRISALAVHLTAPHADLPPGTVVLVSFAGLPAHPAATQTNRKRSDAAKRRHHRRKRYAGRPLRVTPPLGLHEYVFPVVGQSDYVDTYGALRTDVPGHWHHGDDIFASLGTPVVAVAGGTLNRVGWEKIGGWRLWVRDSLGNEFYYAHLSGYSPLALHSTRVRAGDVIGFVGNTGDAFTTSPHVHFEIHPRSLLSLDYDGAVDPTSYLDHWRHLPRVGPPRPTHPPFPSGAVRNEAKFVWRELLAARGLIKHPPKRSEPPPPSVPRFGGISVAPVEHAVAAGPAAAAVDARRGGHSLPTLVLVLLGVIASAGAGSVVLLFRQRRHAHEAAEPTAEAESA